MIKATFVMVVQLILVEVTDWRQFEKLGRDLRVEKTHDKKI